MITLTLKITTIALCIYMLRWRVAFTKGATLIGKLALLALLKLMPFVIIIWLVLDIAFNHVKI